MSSPRKSTRNGTRGYAHLVEVEVPVARVWRALTDPGLIRIWYGQDAEIDPRQALATPMATAAMVEELLRFDAPLHLFTRYALEDVEHDGVAFRQGDRIGLLLGAANRDPERFAGPDLIDASRSPNPHVAFGGGIHFCIGAPLARLEMEIALPILFRRLPKLRLAARPYYRDSYHFHGLAALPVAW